MLWLSPLLMQPSHIAHLLQQLHSQGHLRHHRSRTDISAMDHISLTTSSGGYLDVSVSVSMRAWRTLSGLAEAGMKPTCHLTACSPPGALLCKKNKPKQKKKPSWSTAKENKQAAPLFHGLYTTSLHSYHNGLPSLWSIPLPAHLGQHKWPRLGTANEVITHIWGISAAACI